jgi:NAD(P)-dependent dehydrogenase (short-subunit alcohol dehydrogenase family)
MGADIMTCERLHTVVTGASSGIGRATARRLSLLSRLPAPVGDAARRRVFGLPAPGSLA